MKQTNEVVGHLCRALQQDACGLTDGQLLESFVSRREAAALESLIERHSSMVWGVCRRILLNHHDAEDAFQATFLVLVRKAASISPREMVGNWLYGVAHQTALKARATTAKRRTREMQVLDMPERVVIEPDAVREVLTLLDQELSHLPDKYRSAIVLCDLEGKTRKEAARQIGCPEGTLAAWVARGRVMLAKRLGRHGLALNSGVLATVLAQEASASAPPAMVSSAIQIASRYAAAAATPADLISPEIITLSEGVVKAMLMTKLKAGAVVLGMFGMIAFACGMLAMAKTGTPDAAEKFAAKAEEKSRVAETDKDDTLTVTITPPKNPIRVNEPFNVEWRVVNSSQSPQSIKFMGALWDVHCRFSNDRVTWQLPPAAKNVQHEVTLKPGEANEKAGPMMLVAGRPSEKVSFKMGFTPIGSKQTYWSNEVTLTVEPDRAPEKDMPTLQGKWTAVSLERDGKSLSEEEVKKLDIELNLVFQSGESAFSLVPLASKGPEHFPYGSFRIDTTKKPKEIDFTIRPYYPGMKPSTVLGIYEVDGDSLKLLRGLPDQERPTEFKTTPKSGVEIIVFKRVKL